MSFRDNYDFSILVNESENLVIEELDRQLKELNDPGICTCQDCILDMAAYALNSIKPLYRVSLLGRIYAQALDSGDNAEQVKKAVQKAIQIVHAHPSHD